MYCPVCGDEYVEGVTRCPEHDIDLVSEPPELDESLSWLDRFNDRVILRITFIVFVVAALVYAISGAATAVLYHFIQGGGQDDSFEKAQLAQQIQTAAFPVALAALGILVGALLLRTYISVDGKSQTFGVDGSPGGVALLNPLGHGLMRFLFALSVVFTLLWAVTGIASSQEQIERTSVRISTEVGEEPADAYLLLLTLNLIGYVGGVASLAIMGAGLMVGAHRRISG